jgi:hypothetical protein
MACVFGSPLKGIHSTPRPWGSNRPFSTNEKLLLGSFSGVLCTVPGAAHTAPPTTGHELNADFLKGKPKTGLAHFGNKKFDHPE